MYKNHQNVNRSTIYMNIQNRFRKLSILYHWYEWYASCIKIFSHTLHKVVHMNGNVHKMICFLYTNTLTNLYAKNGMHCYKALSKITTSWKIKVITTSWNMKLYGKIESTWKIYSFFFCSCIKLYINDFINSYRIKSVITEG